MLSTLTREQVIEIYACSHGDLGKLLREKRCPLPVRINGEIFWYKDEVENTKPKVMSILAFRKKAKLKVLI